MNKRSKMIIALLILGGICFFLGCKKIFQLCNCYEIHIDSTNKIEVFELTKLKEFTSYIALEYNGRNILFKDLVYCENVNSAWWNIKEKNNKCAGGEASGDSIENSGVTKKIENFIDESMEYLRIDANKLLSGMSGI